MKISTFALVALISISNFVQCMETTPGSFKDIAEAVKILEGIKKGGGSTNLLNYYDNMMANLTLAMQNLASLTDPKYASQNENTRQKLQSEVTSIEQTQEEIHKDIVAMRKDVTFMSGLVVGLLQNKENAKLTGNIIKKWVDQKNKENV